MPTRRSQRIRFATRAATSAARAIRSGTRAVVKAVRSYRPSRGMKMTGKLFAKGAAAGSVGRVGYNAGRRFLSSVGMTYVGGNDYSKQKTKVGRYKKPTLQRLNRLVQAGMALQTYRFQNITNFDTNVGAFALGNWTFPDGTVQMPFHVYDITSFNNFAATAPGRAFAWASTLGTANVNRIVLPTQGTNGATEVAGTWNLETRGGTNPTATFPNAVKMMHNWTDIRILFYGARKRTTRFDVMFVRIKDEFANLFNGATTNADLRELCQYIERPSIYSPLQSLTGSTVSKRMTIIKRLTYYISAAQTTDVDTSVGKTKEARIFMRHGKLYNLEFKHSAEDGTGVLPHTQDDGLDYNQDVRNHNHPWYGSQVFMIVRAFAPERRTLAANGYPQVADANIDPSYDIIIRNSISTPA